MVIHIELAAYAHDATLQTEEMQTMNSYYHPREHDDRDDRDHKDHQHCHHEHQLPATPMAYLGYENHAGHAEPSGESTERSGERQPEPDNDNAIYRVLVAVERGELSVQDAARRLEELDEQARSQGGGELL